MTHEQGLFETEVYDHIVVGAGIEGSATAYYLAKNGYKTLLIEQVCKDKHFKACFMINKAVRI